MEWLILLLAPLPFLGLYKMASWLDRLDKLEQIALQQGAVIRALASVAGPVRILLLVLGAPYFMYADAKLVSRVSDYHQCPCDGTFPRKQFFCLVTWDFVTELREVPRRPFTSQQLAEMKTLQELLANGTITAEQKEVLKFAETKYKQDTDDLNTPVPYPPIIPLCTNAP